MKLKIVPSLPFLICVGYFYGYHFPFVSQSFHSSYSFCFALAHWSPDHAGHEGTPATSCTDASTTSWRTPTTACQGVTPHSYTVVVITSQIGLCLCFLLLLALSVHVVNFIYGEWFEPRGISYLFGVIIWVRVVFRRTVVGDWPFTSQQNWQTKIPSSEWRGLFTWLWRWLPLR